MSKNVTAPRRWRSSPDSPPTQLAYVTQPEIDMLVNANIHGSMDGKPNVGPKGIISLDGGGGDYQGSKSSGSKSTSSGGGGGGYGERLKSARDAKRKRDAAKDKKEADAKQKAYQKELEKKSNRWFVIGMIFVMAIITYLTIYHKDSSLFSYSNKDTQVYQVARLDEGLMNSGGFLSLHLVPGYHNRNNHG